MSLLEVSGLQVFYGALQALHGVSLRLEEGEIVTLIGSNGAGKTTTLRTISGLLRPRQGTVTLRGRRIESLPPHQIVAAGLAHVPEGRQIFPHMTVEENLRMGAFLRKGCIDDDLAEVYRMFPRLKERMRQAGSTLSGGEQQMLAIGRALMGRPSVLLLDEPALGLSPLLVGEIFKIIRRVNEGGTPILLVEQNASLALSISTRAYVLETGRVVLEGDSHQVAADARVQQAYLGGTAKGV